MGNAAKKIEKVKSLGKRLEIFDEVFSTIEPDEANQIAQLLVEKAKHGEEFTQALAALGRIEFPGKKDFVLAIAEKCNQDPDQSGKAMVVMSNLGYEAEACNYWKKMIPVYNHPNLKARMIVWGTVINGTREEANSLLKEYLSQNPDVPDICYQTPTLDGVWYMTHWKI